jgi:hypothetical protein
MVVLKHWYQNNLRVASFSVSGSSAFVVPAEPERTRSFTQTHPQRAPFQPFYFENALELLDAPGEWYLDTTTGQVFYKPRPGEDLATAVVEAPRLEQLLRVQGTLSAPVHHLQFQGLDFAYSTWLLPSNEGFIGDQASIVFTQPQPADEIASYNGHRIPGAVHLEAANNVVFERNVFRHMGASAVVFYMGTQDNRFTGNVITDVSASGISIDLNLEGNPSDSRKIPRRDVVRNNYVSKVAQEYYGNVGIFTGYTDSVVIEHNEVSDMPYTGISIGWGWADRDSAIRNTLVRFNHIWSVVDLLDDGAGVYTLSKQPGTIVAENYIHDVIRSPWSGGHIMGGVYLDQGSNLITVRDNVLQNNVAPIVTNAPGSGNTLVNNGGASPTTIANSGLEPAYQDIRPSP